MNNRQITSFLIALILVGFLIEFIDKISPRASWILSIIIVLGMVVNNPFVIYWLSIQLNNLRSVTNA